MLDFTSEFVEYPVVDVHIIFSLFFELVLSSLDTISILYIKYLNTFLTLVFQEHITNCRYKMGELEIYLTVNSSSHVCELWILEVRIMIFMHTNIYFP